MVAINYFLALRTIALREVLNGGPDYWLRQVFRWYSREFSVPLPSVSDLPMDHVLQAYYECHYEKMEEDDREAERHFLIETDEDRRKRLADEERRVVEDLEYERAAAAEAVKAKMEKTSEEAKTIAKLAEGDKKPFGEVFRPGTKLPPNISLSFAPEADFEAALEVSSTGGLDTNNLPLKSKPLQPPVLK